MVKKLIVILVLLLASISAYGITMPDYSNIKNTPSIDVRYFGAKGDGVTDDSSAFNAALISSFTNITAASSQSFLVESPIVFAGSGKRLTISAPLVASMTASNSTGVIEFRGTSGDISSITSDVVAGTTTVNVVDGSLFAASDTVIIENDYLDATAIETGMDSKLAYVQSVIGNTVTLDRKTIFEYPSAHSRLRKVTLSSGNSLDFISIRGAYGNAIHLQWAKGNAIRGGVIPDCGINAVCFRSSYENIVSGISVTGVKRTDSPWGYGALFERGASNNTLENSSFYGIREISLADNSCFNIVSKNTIVRPVDSGVNTHGWRASYNVISDNSIYGSLQYGISIGLLPSSGGHHSDFGNVVKGNTIYFPASHGIREVQYPTAYKTNNSFDGNTIVGAGGDGINVSNSVATMTLGTIISGNKIFSPTRAGVILDGAGANGCVVSNNVVYGCEDGIRNYATSKLNYFFFNVVSSANHYGFQQYVASSPIAAFGNYAAGSGSSDWAGFCDDSPANASGTWATGTVVFRQSNWSDNAPLGWACISGGTPGTWLPFGHVKNTTGIGSAREFPWNYGVSTYTLLFDDGRVIGLTTP